MSRKLTSTEKFLKDFLTMIQRNLQALVISARTDKGTEFLNNTLNAFFKEEGIEHQTSTPRAPEQNGRYGENLDKMKEKGDPCILVGYSTQSKGYRVYNKRTRLIVESIHLRFDEIKEMSETSVANDTSGLVPQRQKASDYDNPDPAPELQNVSPSADTIVPSQQELDLLFGPLYDEFFNDGTSRVNKSSSPTDNSIQTDTLPSTNTQPTSEPTTPTNVHAEENNDNQAEFTNPFCTPVLENAESSSRNIGTSNMHTFHQPQDSEYRWTKDHPLTQVRGNPSKPVQTRLQLATDPEMCMFALTDSLIPWIFQNSLPSLRKASIWIKTSSGLTMVDESLQNFVSKGFTKAFSDADHASCVDTRKSTSRGIQFLGDKLVNWMSKKQDCTVMSSAEAEYVALSASCAQVMWMRTQLQDYGFNYNKIPLYYDSESAIAISCNPVQHSRTIRKIVSVSCQANWYEMFDSSRTGGSDT
ncbi:retrovirus-related pol polyprotein from transposon TNT 1-94 [Tanacetum coccineum]